MAYTRDRREAGGTWAEISEELGVSAGLLQRWQSGVGSGFARVEVVEEAAARSTEDQGLRLVTPQGHEVIGLDVEQTAELLRLLS